MTAVSIRTDASRLVGLIALCIVVSCGVASCHRRVDIAPASAEGSGATGAGYVAPPQLLAAQREVDGFTLRGSAPAGAVVTLKSPDGASVSAVAASDGSWIAALPGAETPRVYAWWMDAAGRRVRGEGAVATAPAPATPVLLLRAGFAALPLPTRGSKPALTTVDYDAVGGVATGGTAPAGARVQLAVDGLPADAGRADALGRFQLMGPKSRPLAPGRRRLTLSSGTDRTEVALVLSPPAPLGDAPLRTVRESAGWRIDWALPGGGEQTTIILDPSAPSSPPPPLDRKAAG